MKNILLASTIDFNRYALELMACGIIIEINFPLRKKSSIEFQDCRFRINKYSSRDLYWAEGSVDFGNGDIRKMRVEGIYGTNSEDSCMVKYKISRNQMREDPSDDRNIGKDLS